METLWDVLRTRPPLQENKSDKKVVGTQSSPGASLTPVEKGPPVYSPSDLGIVPRTFGNYAPASDRTSGGASASVLPSSRTERTRGSELHRLAATHNAQHGSIEDRGPGRSEPIPPINPNRRRTTVGDTEGARDFRQVSAIQSPGRDGRTSGNGREWKDPRSRSPGPGGAPAPAVSRKQAPAPDRAALDNVRPLQHLRDRVRLQDIGMVTSDAGGAAGAGAAARPPAVQQSTRSFTPLRPPDSQAQAPQYSLTPRAPSTPQMALPAGGGMAAVVAARRQRPSAPGGPPEGTLMPSALSPARGRAPHRASEPVGFRATTTTTTFGTTTPPGSSTNLRGLALAIPEGAAAPPSAADPNNPSTPYEPKWVGELGGRKRHAVLRGGTVVTEAELSQVFTLYNESVALGRGEFSISAVKAYAAQADSKSSMLGLANAICSALAKSRNVMDGAPGFHDILCLTYSKASRDEIDFLARSAEELRESQKEKTGLPARTLSWEEVRLSMQVFDMLNKNDMGMVSITHLIHQMLLAFPDINESAVLRQLRYTVPSSYSALDKDAFQRWLTIHLAAEEHVDLSAWVRVMTGHEVVLGRIVHQGERITDQELMEELRDAKPDTALTRLMQKIRKAKQSFRMPKHVAQGPGQAGLNDSAKSMM